MESAFDTHAFEASATSDLFEELTLALGDMPDGARQRWSGVRGSLSSREASQTRVSSPCHLHPHVLTVLPF